MEERWEAYGDHVRCRLQGASGALLPMENPTVVERMELLCVE
jgi:hypothetical protein